MEITLSQPMIAEQRKILLVDDEPGLLFSLRAFLEDEGYLAVTCSSGEEALDLLRNHVYDAVIIDIRLPGKDGNEVIFQAKEAGCTACFLIHTGSTDYQIPDYLRKIGLGQDDIFLKPLADLEILSSTLQKRLKPR